MYVSRHKCCTFPFTEVQNCIKQSHMRVVNIDITLHKIMTLAWRNNAFSNGYHTYLAYLLRMFHCCDQTERYFKFISNSVGWMYLTSGKFSQCMKQSGMGVCITSTCSTWYDIGVGWITRFNPIPYFQVETVYHVRKCMATELLTREKRRNHTSVTTKSMTGRIYINPNSPNNKGSCWILKDLYCSVTTLTELKLTNNWNSWMNSWLSYKDVRTQMCGH